MLAVVGAVGGVAVEGVRGNVMVRRYPASPTVFARISVMMK
jgi:hypothetical protein